MKNKWITIFKQHAFSVEPSSVKIDNVSLENKLQGTEGLDLKISCKAVGGKPLPDVKLIFSEVTIAKGKQSILHTLPTVNRSMDRMTITCQAGYEEFLHYPLVDSANLYLNCKLFILYVFLVVTYQKVMLFNEIKQSNI